MLCTSSAKFQLSKARLTISLALITVVVVYVVVAQGGVYPTDSNIALAILGLTGVGFALRSDPLPRDRLTLLAAVLFPVFVAFQLVPLPLFLLRILSPTRVEIADALGRITPALSFAPITIVPAETWVHASRIAGYTLLFLLVREMARQSTRGPWLLAVPLITIGALEAAWGLSQHLSGAESVSGTYLNKDHFAGLLEMILPFAVMYSITVLSRERVRNTFSAVSAIKASGVSSLALGIFLAITFSLSRMGFISALGSLFVMGMVALGSRLSGWRKWPALALLGVIILLLFVFVPSNQLVEQFGHVASDQISQGRWPIWKDTLHLIAAYPLFGSGFGTYYPALLRYETYGFDFAWLNAHNDYLQLLSELGVVGFLILAALMIGVLTGATREAVSGVNTERRSLGLACVGGIAAMLIHSFADFNMYVPANAMTLSWIAGISAGLPLSGSPEQPKRSLVTPSFLRGFLLVLGCSVAIYSAASLIFMHSFKSDPRAERVFCRFGICDSYDALAALQSQHNGDITAIPSSEFVELLRRDPAGPYRWEDLGGAMQKDGRTAQASYCFARAITLGPRIPSMLFRAADFQFGLGGSRRGLDLMARAMQSDPEQYDQSAFSVYEERRVSVDEILRFGLPNPRAYQAYLRFLISREKSADAGETWDWILSRRYADDKLSNEYVEFLMHSKKPEAAQQAWACYAGTQEKGYPEENRVFNGNFELDPSGSRFDWRIESAQGAAIDFDRAVHYSGARSLRIQFDGTQNVSNIGVGQTVFLKPGRYRFEAYVRTSEVSTDEGVAFNVLAEAGGDSGEGNKGIAERTRASAPLNFTTQGMLGTSNWKLVEREFEVRPGMGLVQVSLVRKPSLRFDNLIRGTVWVDQVRIRPVQMKERGERK